jgi:hypothetical protein
MREARQWMPWVLATPSGVDRPIRVLVDPQTDSHAYGASPNQQTTFLKALRCLERRGWRGGDDRAGLAYIFDSTGDPRRPARRAAFFSLPNMQQMDARQARLEELAEPHGPEPGVRR